MLYPAEYTVRVIDHQLHHVATVPGSKSITNRALVLAALMARQGPRLLFGALRSEDTEIMLAALDQLGFEFVPYWDQDAIGVGKLKGASLIRATSANLDVGNSGTSMRFLAAMVALGRGRYRLDGVPRMRERPIQDLLDALQGLGVNARSESGTGCPPVVIESEGLWSPGPVSVRASVSSQFLSGLLLAAPFCGSPITIRTEGQVVSEPYIEMTLRMLREWMCEIDSDAQEFRVRPIRSTIGGPGKYRIEPDASAASYFFAAAAIAGGSVTVRGMKRDMLQGDVRFVDALAMMGCDVVESDDGIGVTFDPMGRTLQGIDIDMNAISDTVMTLAAVACFADSPTTIRNVAHIRHKETDRIAAVATELRKLGVEVDEFEDGLKITPRPMTGCALDTYNDHRMAMSLALIGLKVPGVVIRNPGCVAKTYPGFWNDFEKLYS